MRDEELLENLNELKEEYDLKEISLFDSEGFIIHTTQDEEFTAHKRYYALPPGAAKLISEAHDDMCKGITIELEETEFFLRFLTEDNTIWRDVIISFEYESNSKDRKKIKSIADELNDLVLEWE